MADREGISEADRLDPATGTVVEYQWPTEFDTKKIAFDPARKNVLWFTNMRTARVSRVEILDIKMLPIETAQGSYTPQLVRHSPPTTSKSCLTADQAKAPSERFLAGVAYSQCQSDKFTMAKGRIGGTVTCTGQGQATNFALEGRYTATSYDVTTRAEVRAAGVGLR